MRKYLLLLVALIVLTITACTQEPQLTPLEMQSLQQREFPVSKEVSFAATVSVLQDLGYIVDQADFNSGLITASSPTKRNTETRATAFIENWRAGESRVRLNFVTSKTRNVNTITPTQNNGGTIFRLNYLGTRKNDTQILNPAIYQSAFEKIETAIFLRY